MRRRLQSVLPALLLRPCRIPNGMSCIKGHRLPQLQVTTSLCAMQAKDPGAPAFLSTTRALPALFTAGRDGQRHSSSCNPVLAQRELQALAVQTEEMLLPWGAVARAQKSWLSCATETWVSLPLKISEIGKTLEPGAFPWLGNDQTSSHWVWRSAAAPFPRGRSNLFFRAAAPAPQSCWAQQ